MYRLPKLLKIQSKSENNGTVWDFYDDAIQSKKMNCTEKFPACPLSQKQLRYETRLGISL
jgi:hypothetical protein